MAPWAPWPQVPGSCAGHGPTLRGGLPAADGWLRQWSRRRALWIQLGCRIGLGMEKIWKCVKTYDAIFGWMNIHLPSILMFTRVPWFWPMAIWVCVKTYSGWWWLEHDFYFPIYWECHHPNWLSYFSGGLSWSKTGEEGIRKPQTSMYLSDKIPLFYFLY